MISHLKKRLRKYQYSNWSSIEDSLGIRAIKLTNGMVIPASNISCYEIFEDYWKIYVGTKIFNIRHKDKKLDLLVRGMCCTPIKKTKRSKAINEKPLNVAEIVEPSNMMIYEMMGVLSFMTLLMFVIFIIH